MTFKRIILADLLLSAIIAAFVTPIIALAFHFSLAETFATIGFLFVALFAVILVISLLETQLHKGNPFKDLLVLSSVSLIFALVASIESLISDVNVLLFLPFDILFLLTMARSYQLAWTFQKRGTKDSFRVRDSPLHDRMFIALYFIGFFIFLGLAIYFFHWIV